MTYSKSQAFTLEKINQERKTQSFCRIRLKDILTILCSVSIPVAMAVYTTLTERQQERDIEKAREFQTQQRKEMRQQEVFERFLDNIYKLDKDGYLHHNKSPWAFANAYYRVAHRQWDRVRKAEALQFMKDKGLIGVQNCTSKCHGTLKPDIIRLIALNFDDLQLASETGIPNSLNLDCVVFEQVSMNNAFLTNVNLHGSSFTGGTLSNVKFENVSLSCMVFDGTNLTGVDFGSSNLQGVVFSNVDLTGAKISDEQISQAVFHNSRLPSGILSENTTTSKSMVNFSLFIFTF